MIWRCDGTSLLTWTVVVSLSVTPGVPAQTRCGSSAIGTHALHSCLHGSGRPTVILAAGAGQTSRTWNGLIDSLAPTYTVLTFDRAGLGRSEAGPHPRTPTVIAEELWRLIEVTGTPGPFVLVGHSAGGWHMLRLAESRPDWVVGVVLVDTPPPAFEQRRLELLPPPEQAARRAIVAEGIRTASPVNRAERQGAPPDLARGFGQFPRRVPLTVIVGDAQEFGAGEYNDAHRSLWVEMSRGWLDLSERGVFRVVSGSGHMVHHVAPGVIREAIEGVIDRAPGRR